MPHHCKKLFLSIVSNEFASYRELLAQDLHRPNLEVATQENFINAGCTTLEKLDEYLRGCDGVIHIIGKAAGTVPPEPAVSELLRLYPDLASRLSPLAVNLDRPQPGFSYTQWEAYLALYHHLALHHQRPLFVYRPTDFDLATHPVPRDGHFVFDPCEKQSQCEHYERICALGHDRGQFLNQERLSSAVLRDLVEILPRLEQTIDVPPTRLPHTAERLIGREEDLARLDAAWNEQSKNVVVIRAFGGMGKTSLVTTWMAELAMKRWRGAERVFDWSFYDQGTSEQRVASADTFIAAALAAFGDPDPTLGSPWERGARLAQLVGKVRCLLVLDGLEPLQYPPGPSEGKLKDRAMEALLKGLAGLNAGLCVVTSREKVSDIKQHYGFTAEDIALTHLTDLAGAALLHRHGATRAGAITIQPDDRELQAASREVRGHGLTLQLLGQYLRLVEGGDIRQRDTVRLAEADQEYQNDATRPYGHAFKAMEAYENWFQRADERGHRQLAVLRLLGLFDRPAAKECLAALREEPVIPGLTDSLVGLAPRDWSVATARLEEINLLTVQADGSLDAHPLLREYFGRQLREQMPEAWRAAHERLYELFRPAPDFSPETLEDLMPCYRAISHGCQAGLHNEALEEVYRKFIQQGQVGFAQKVLGASGEDLAALSWFFHRPWTEVHSSIHEQWQAWLPGNAGSRLRALTRIQDAVEPTRRSLELAQRIGDMKLEVIRTRQFSELQLVLGGISHAEKYAEAAVVLADKAAAAIDHTVSERNAREQHYETIMARSVRADVLHAAGRLPKAQALFEEAEELQRAKFPDHPLLHSLWGFHYCDLLLAQGRWEEVLSRVTQTVRWAESRLWSGLGLLDLPLDKLTLARCHLRQFDGGEKVDLGIAAVFARDGMTLLRQSGKHDFLPLGYLVLVEVLQRQISINAKERSARLHEARQYLDEAWEIAERGPMPLYLADLHLQRARLFAQETPYPWNKHANDTPRGPEDDRKEAHRLIKKHGYWRRKKDLEEGEE